MVYSFHIFKLIYIFYVAYYLKYFKKYYNLLLNKFVAKHRWKL